MTRDEGHRIKVGTALIPIQGRVRSLEVSFKDIVSITTLELAELNWDGVMTVKVRCKYKNSPGKLTWLNVNSVTEKPNDRINDNYEIF